MSRVKRITVANLKAISEMAADFNGCTAIITGGNNKGKSSFLRSLPDRIHGVKPDVILKKGEVEGKAEWELTTGEKIVWSFEEKPKKGSKVGELQFSEKLTFITSENIKGALTRELALRFFPPTFNVDDFLNSAPKAQKAMLQKLVGLDFTEVDAKYDRAYLDREGKNRRAYEEKVVFEKMKMPEEIQPVKLDQLMFDKAAVRNKLNTMYLSNKSRNEKMRGAWELACEEERIEVEEFNKVQTERKRVTSEANQALTKLRQLGYNGQEVVDFIQSIVDQVEELKVYQPLVEPEYMKEMPDDSELVRIDARIADAVAINEKANAYTKYIQQRQAVADTKAEAEVADRVVKAAEEERMELIRSAKMPEGFGFNEDGITYTGLPFTREQLSSSGIYIAALKLAAMTLGEVRVLHFDASFLDKQSLGEIENWAKDQELQLLIERPDFDGGEIHYQLLTEGGKP